MNFTFPEKFMIGAATAAHQVEGNNVHSDFWMMEQMKNTTFIEPSNDAANHYNLYKTDIAMLANLGLNSYRFSIEWARIEPQEDVYDEKEIAHYRDMLLACHEHHITPIVTLHHFSSPSWLISAGGWESDHIPARFAKYCTYVMEQLGELVPYVCTINEANIAIGIAKSMKQFTTAQVGLNQEFNTKMKAYMEELCIAFNANTPSEVQHFLSPKSEKGLKLIFESHLLARDSIKRVSPNTKVGLTMSLHYFQSIAGGESYAEEAWQEEFIQFLPYIEQDDFFGLQNYTREVYGPEGLIPVGDQARKTQMGYEYYPQGLEHVIRFVAKHISIPIIVTENGIATEDDKERVDFIQTALNGVAKCLEDGINIKGYMHWSLLDNFEWQLGYSRTFGLISIDRVTQQRTIKRSATYLGEIARTKQLHL